MIMIMIIYIYIYNTVPEKIIEKLYDCSLAPRKDRKHPERIQKTCGRIENLQNDRKRPALKQKTPQNQKVCIPEKPEKAIGVYIYRERERQREREILPEHFLALPNGRRKSRVLCVRCYQLAITYASVAVCYLVRLFQRVYTLIMFYASVVFIMYSVC